MLEHFLVAAAAHITVDVSKEAIKKAFDYVATSRPDIAKAAAVAENAGDMRGIDNVFHESIGIINVAAEKGIVKLDKVSLTALNSIRFDHQNGQISIAGTTLSSNVLVTGGSTGSTGITTLGDNTWLKSQGTAIEIGHGASIVISGGARIEQT